MDAHELFEILVREHADMLTTYLQCVVRNPQAVDDLFQETMLTAWRRLDDFDRSRPFGPWLRGIAARLVLAYRRQAARDLRLCDAAVLERIDFQMERLAAQPGDTWDDRLRCLRDCLSALPEPYAEVVRLRYREDLAVPQMAERLATNVETLKKRLQRARARLLECLERKLAIEGISP